MKQRLAINSIRIILTIVFLYSGLIKLLNHESFYLQIKQSPLIESFSLWISWLIPVIELIVVFLLIRKHMQVWGFYLSLGLLLFFTGYLIYLSFFSFYIPCGCGGFFNTLSLSVHTLINFILICLSLIAIILERKINSFQTSVSTALR
jgi:hypothetical protein